MTAPSRYHKTDLRREVIKADPNWVKDRRTITEYEFANGRKFKANYDQRGAYAADEEE